MRKPRCYAEVYNDLDGEVVNVFRVLRDPDSAAQLSRALTLTPYARAEFEDAHTEPAGDTVEMARRTIIRSFMGFGSDSLRHEVVTGFRASSNRSGTTPAHDWMHFPSNVPAFIDRLQGVVIEQRPAADVITKHDRTDALIYADPPYVHSTRSAKANHAGPAGRAHGYRHEMTDDDHRSLAELLHSAAGMVVISGYQSPLYDDLYGDWPSVQCHASADGARRRTEVLWLSPRCYEAAPLNAPMFAEEASA